MIARGRPAQLLRRPRLEAERLQSRLWNSCGVACNNSKLLTILFLKKRRPVNVVPAKGG